MADATYINSSFMIHRSNNLILSCVMRMLEIHLDTKCRRNRAESHTHDPNHTLIMEWIRKTRNSVLDLKSGDMLSHAVEFRIIFRKYSIHIRLRCSRLTLRKMDTVMLIHLMDSYGRDEMLIFFFELRNGFLWAKEVNAKTKMCTRSLCSFHIDAKSPFKLWAIKIISTGRN